MASLGGAGGAKTGLIVAVAEQYERIGIVQQLHYVASHGRAFWIGNAFPFFFQGLIKTF